MTLSIVVVIAMFGYVIREQGRHRAELAASVQTREENVTAYLEELCERLEIRDEIQVGYLQAAAARYTKSDPDYAETLSRAAEALLVSQSGCREGIPSTEEGG